MLSDDGMDLILRNARTHNFWQDKPVSDLTLQALHELLRHGPTSANCSPARFLFIRTPEGKARLAPHLSDGNHDKTMAAPVTAIIAYDMRFYEHLAKLFPHNLDARTWFEGNDEVVFSTAFRNGTLQGAYLMIAARALGLDIGAMSGFDNAGVDAEFFPDGSFRSNFLCNIGYGDPTEMPPKNPRPDFDEVCELL